MSGPAHQTFYGRGLLMSASGMFVISPDGLLLRLVRDATPWDLIFYRTLFLGIGLGFVLLVRYRTDVGRVLRRMGRLGLLSAFLMAASNITFVGAIAQTTVANTLVILATMPLFSAVLAWLLISEKVGGRTWVSILVALAGIVIIFAESLGTGHWMGNALAALTALGMGLNLVVLRHAGTRDVIPALCLSGFAAAAAVLPFAAAPSVITGQDMAVMAFMGFVVLPVSLCLFFGGTRYVPAAEVALLALIETVLGPLWTWLGVGETPSPLSLLGGGIVIAAIAVNAGMALRASSRSVA